VTSPAVRALWAGRSLAVIGIILIAVNLRTAVGVISPIVDSISVDIALSSIGIGFLGMLPPLAFAASGIAAPLLARRLGLEATLLLACVAMSSGSLVRAFSSDYVILALGSVLVLSGMGCGNVLMPPAVKRYFPDRIGGMTAAYATVVVISAGAPPLFAAPIADATSWRVSVGIWAVLAIVAAVPWIFLWARRRTAQRARRADGDVGEPEPKLLGSMIHSRVAWAMSLAFAIPSFNVYAVFAWLPEIITSLTTFGPAEAGALLAIFAVMGLPVAFLAPIIATRIGNISWLLALGSALFVGGYLGLLFAPSAATWVWVAMIGSGPIVFPVTLTLVNLRTRTHEASVALSGFVQSIGYAIAAVGPLAVGVIHDLSGNWTLPLVFLIATALVALIPSFMLARPRAVEDDLHAWSERRAGLS